MNYDKDYDNYSDDYDYDKYDESYKEDYHDAYYTDESYDDPSYQNNLKKSIDTIFDDDEELENNDNESDEKLMKSMDNDLAGYFSDARLFAPKKKLVDTMKKKPKRIIHKAGTKVIASINRQVVNGTVLFGPYESNKKQMYQIELESGDLAEIDEKKIKAAH